MSATRSPTGPRHAIVAAVAAVATAWVGVPTEGDVAALRAKLRPGAVIALTVGIGLGSPAGIYVRDHRLLAPPTDAPAAMRREPTESGASPPSGGLYSVGVDECVTLRAGNEVDIKRRFEQLADKDLRAMTRFCDPQCLLRAVPEVCQGK